MLLSKFCFFLSLSTGTVIIGVLNTLYGFLQTVYEFLLVNIGHSHPKPFTHEHLELQHVAEEAVNVLYSQNSLYTMQLVFGIYLIYGSVKEKPSFVFANIIVHVAFAAYSSCFVAFAVVRILWEESIPRPYLIIDELLKIPILLYFAFVIYSRHEELVLKSPTMMGPIDRRQITDSDTEDIRLPA